VENIQSSHKNKVIITVALTGGLHGKEANPNLPEQPDELIQSALACREAGAAIVHIHARDKNGAPSGDPEIFREINEGIRAESDMVIQDTTGGPSVPWEDRIKALDTGCEMASLNMGSVHFFLKEMDQAKLDTLSPHMKGSKIVPFVNTRPEILTLAELMLEKNVKPEMEVYNPSMLMEVEYLISTGLLQKPYYVNFVMGVTGMGGFKGDIQNLLMMQRLTPPECLINVTGIGPSQLTMNTTAILLGFNTRVGMEDNVYYKYRELAESNEQLVKRVVRLANELEREIATPTEAREILGLKQLS